MSWGFFTLGITFISLIVGVAVIGFEIYESQKDEKRHVYKKNPPQPVRSFTCEICLNPTESDMITLNCNHNFHNLCFFLVVENEVANKRSCPKCRTYIPESFIKKHLK